MSTFDIVGSVGPSIPPSIHLAVDMCVQLLAMRAHRWLAGFQAFAVGGCGVIILRPARKTYLSDLIEIDATR